MITSLTTEFVKANGTAIEGVCVTGEAIRLIVPVASMELSRWRAGMAQFLQSRRIERVKLDRHPGRAAMLSL
jgi:hypothetical protein